MAQLKKIKKSTKSLPKSGTKSPITSSQSSKI